MKLPSRLRRIQEVQRVARRRGVHDHQIPAVFGQQLAELFHRHVLLRAGQRGGNRLVKLVVQNRLCAFGSGVLDHHLVEGAAHVEHHREELAGYLGGERHALRRVAEIADAQRLRQPLGRVDRQNNHGAAVLRRAQRHGRGGGGLTDPTRAAAHHDTIGGVLENAGDIQSRRCGAHRTPCCARDSDSS